MVGTRAQYISLAPVWGPCEVTRVLCFPLGQFYDYLHLLSLTGEPGEKHCLLMNGDLVDRGSWSVEVILTALAFKCE